MFTVLAVIPLTTPPLTVATPVLLDDHTPPLGLPTNVVVPPPVHVLNVPLIDGKPVTVTTVLLLQPAAVVYSMVDVPDINPLTTPSVPMVATLVLLLLQLPPPGAHVNVVVAPSHTNSVPPIALGLAFTVTTPVTLQPSPIV